MRGFVVRRYEIPAPITKKIALISDLHEKTCAGLWESVAEARPDILCLSGDMLERTSRDRSAAVRFMTSLSSIAPAYYVTGNHEGGLRREEKRALAQGGVIVADGAVFREGNVYLAGLPSLGGDAILRRLSGRRGYRILLCHHPEYYDPRIRPLPIDLVLSGHTHGGQWRIGRQGVFAPGQGLFPKYSGGVYEDRLVVSRGLANTAPVPRFFNPKEWVLISLHP